MSLFRAPHAVRERGLTRSDRRKLLLLCGGLVLVLGALLWSARLAGRAAPASPVAPAEPALAEETLLLPRIDAERLGRLVADAEPADRVVLEGAALDVLLPEARRLTPRSYEALAEEELTPERRAALLAGPATARAKAFFARGRIDALRTRRRDPAGPEERIGRLRLEDDGAVYFLVLDAPEDGGYVRVDGLFLKVYSDESEAAPGTWIEGPLLIGARAVRSSPALGEVAAPDEALYETAVDADLVPSDGGEPRIVREPAFEPFWHLMAYARDVAPDALDWDAAPELDAALLERWLAEPAAWRARPFRLPLCEVQAVQVTRAGENPARIEATTQGWLGHGSWRNVVRFQAPFADRAVAQRDLVEGRGFFLADLAYESQGKGLRVAPLVVLHSLSVFVPPPQHTLLRMALLIAATFMVAIGIFVGLLRRDRRSGEAFQRELVQRRRARRGRLPSAP